MPAWLKHLLWGNKYPFQNNVLYSRLARKGFKPEHVAEVGVYYPETSNVYGWIVEGVRATLVEANPLYVKAIQNHFADALNINIISKAVYDKRGSITLYQRDSSSFIGELPSSPALINDHYHHRDQDKIEVEAVLFSDIDDGSIDLLSIDIEGSDWYVLKHMISKPKVISIETHGKKYKNPYLAEIQRFMQNSGYQVWYKDASDTVYYQKGFFKQSCWERASNSVYGWFPKFRY